MNNQAVDRALDALHRVTVPESWLNAADEDKRKEPETLPDFILRIQGQWPDMKGMSFR